MKPRPIARCEFIEVGRGKGLFTRCGAKCRIGEALCPKHMTKRLSAQHRLLTKLLVPNWEFVQEAHVGAEEEIEVVKEAAPRLTWAQIRQNRREQLEKQRKDREAARERRQRRWRKEN